MADIAFELTYNGWPGDVDGLAIKIAVTLALEGTCGHASP
jgi:hypothetical protein